MQDEVTQPAFGPTDSHRPSIADQLVTQLEAAIDERGLKPGHRFGTKEDLRKQFRVAPATLAEAIRVLRSRGVLDVRPGPGGGIFVAAQSPLVRLGHSVVDLDVHGASAKHCLAVLDVLDQEVALDAAAHRSAADITELGALIRELAQSWPDPDRAQTTNWKLHRRLAEISPNPLLRTMYVHLVDYIATDLGSIIPPTHFRTGSGDRLQVHLDLVQAIIDGDQHAAEAAALRHRGLTRTDR